MSQAFTVSAEAADCLGFQPVYCRYWRAGYLEVIHLPGKSEKRFQRTCPEKAPVGSRPLRRIGSSPARFDLAGTQPDATYVLGRENRLICGANDVARFRMLIETNFRVHRDHLLTDLE